MPRRRPRLSRLIARLLSKERDSRAQAPRAAGHPRPRARRISEEPAARTGDDPARMDAQGGLARPQARADRRPVAPEPAQDSAPTAIEAPLPLDLDRIETMLTGPMGYAVRQHSEEGHSCLLGTWDEFPFVIEIPQGHEGWLLVSGDWQEPAPASQRDEIASSANDWNRDKFFPTVGVLDGPMGPRVRATYMVDLNSGITDTQLRLHLNTALSSCTQALSAVGPLLPEI
ncbi:YbjN domain-containing protein [Actinomyces slackii]|nr:YbjN domain-containing protein [Actinomyces slackii]